MMIAASQDHDVPAPPLRLGIAGLGMAGAMMIRAAAHYPGVTIRAAADPHSPPREAFARDFGVAYADVGQLCEDPAVEAVYIATPHQAHAAHAILAAAHGKHIILEKPMALTLEDCDAIIAAVERCGVTLIVGHTHAFDPAVRTMRGIIASGEIGELATIATFNYTDYLYRPRRPEELDTAQGGGIMFNQVPHQVDVIRLLGGGRLRSVRAQVSALDRARPTEGGCVAFLAFESGASASLVYSGYDFFDSDELHLWISEAGAPKCPGTHGAARRALAASVAPETQLRIDTYAYRGGSGAPAPHQPHFGITIATCARGELRASRDGVIVYDETGSREVPLRRGPGEPGRIEVLDAMRAALRTGRRPVHDGRWGKASVEAALAILRSSREGREITLEHQVAVPAGS
jgi:phthalate 4,5-cis-dihydrodiol dehydrogenase